MIVHTTINRHQINNYGNQNNNPYNENNENQGGSVNAYDPEVSPPNPERRESE